MNLEEFREKVKRERGLSWIRSALRARDFSGKETFKQAINLTKFAVSFRKCAK